MQANDILGVLVLFIVAPIVLCGLVGALVLISGWTAFVCNQFGKLMNFII